MAFKVAGPQWERDFENILSFGPRRIGPNILINRLNHYEGTSMWNAKCKESENFVTALLSSIQSGFDLGVSVGPLCDEPMTGVAFLLEGFDVVNSEPSTPLSPSNLNSPLVVDEAGANVNDIDILSPVENLVGGVVRRRVFREETYGPVSGQIMSGMKEACRRSFMTASCRLVEAVYKCSMQCTSDQLGNLYSIISKRRGKVLREEIWEGSNLFHIECTLPVVESFGFADDLRKSTSGAVQYPQLVFR